MERIESHLSTSSDEFKRNKDAMEALVKRLRAEIDRIREGGSAHARQLHVERGKLLARASIITGIGRIHGRETVVVANDATIKGGTYFPMSVKKHLRAQQIAIENQLPCVYLVDSGGAFLPLQSDIFPD